MDRDPKGGWNSDSFRIDAFLDDFEDVMMDLKNMVVGPK